MSEDAGDELLTGRDVQRLLNISQATLDRWSKTGRLQPLRLPNGYRRYKRADVVALLADRESA